MTTSLLDTCASIFRGFIGTTTPATANMKMEDDKAAAVDKKAGLFAQCSFALVRTAIWPQKEVDLVSPLTRLKTSRKGIIADVSRSQPS